MAGDWIKMRIDLQTHPKVVRILSATQSDKFRVIGGLHAVWTVFDTHCEDGVLNGYTPEALDHIIGWQGFSAAMIDVGWLQDIGNSSLVMPEFCEHNGASGKRRAEDQKRKRDSRKNPQPVRDLSEKSRTESGPEKRREEKNKYIRPSDVSEQVWTDYVAHRKAKKSTISNSVIDSLRVDASKVGLNLEQAMMMQIKRGWTGFEPSWVTTQAANTSNVMRGVL